MDDKTPAPGRRFAPQKQEMKNLLENIRASAGFISIMGFMIGVGGMITFEAFHNTISMFMLDVGFGFFLFGLVAKLTDICVQLIGDRRG